MFASCFRACRRFALLALLTIAPAIPSAGQPATVGADVTPAAAPPGATPSPASTIADGEILDVNRIEPDSFAALAVRVPAGQAPKIDGRLDDQVWQLAPPQEDFIQREPRFGARSTERTTFRLLYDDRRIYVAIWAWDSNPSGIRASELKRDAGLRKGDQIKIVFDTFHDHRNAFYFSTNPLGAYKDAYSAENGRIINYDWNAVWENETSRDDKGWYVEIAIPLSQLRFKGSLETQVWGLNICRIIIRKNEETYWVPYPREWTQTGFSRVSNAGTIAGLHDLPSRRRLEVVPFLTPTVARDVSAGTPTDADSGYGVDARVGLTQNLTADLTFKTDFAQVEADQEVVNLSRFSLFLPEKRQFFTESAGIYDFGIVGTTGYVGGDIANEAGLLQVFYSRRIGLADGREVPILGGGKVTGRAGAYTIGALNIETDEARLRTDVGSTLAIPRANYSAIRVKRDILRQSSLGMIVLNRQGGLGSDYNRTIGFDSAFLVSRALTFAGIFAKTFTPGVSGRDLAFAGDVNWKTDRFQANGTYLDVGERFNAEMGFIPRVDIRNTRLKAGWTPRPKWRGVRQVSVLGSVNYFEDHQGRPDSRLWRSENSISFNDSSTFKAIVDHEFDRLTVPFVLGPIRYRNGSYDWNRLELSYSTNQSRRVYSTVGLEHGGYYGGQRDVQRLALNFLLMDTLLVESSYTRNVVSAPAQPTYTTNVVSSRVSYSFSPDLFVKGFVQYNDARRLASLNLLLWYIYKPGSDFYVVYNQGWDTDLPRPGAGFLETRSRSLTVKMTYWFSR